jgi:signal transduction histidine kinase
MLSKTSALLSESQMISHEFVNSLTSLRSLSELLVDYPGLDAGDRTRFLNIIREETERLVRLYSHLNGCPAWSDRRNPTPHMQPLSA